MGVDPEEASYLMEKLYNMAINQSYIAAQKELAVKEAESREKDVSKDALLKVWLIEMLISGERKELTGLFAYSCSKLAISRSSSCNICTATMN